MILAAPDRYFLSSGQAIFFRGAGLEVVWPQLLTLVGIGTVFFIISLTRFRKTIGAMA
jgi:ABC-2 type transport system permease protein